MFDDLLSESKDKKREFYKYTMCRYKGYTFSMSKQNGEDAVLYTADDEFRAIFNMKVIDRGEYELTVPFRELECIWEEITYPEAEPFNRKKINVLKGNLVVTNGKKRTLTFDSPYLKEWDFIVTKYGTFKMISGWYYMAVSVDEDSQKLGFIYQEPGIYTKYFYKDEIIDHYDAHTFSTYKGLKFWVTNNKEGKVLLQPYSMKESNVDYLKTLGFKEQKSWVEKWVDVDETEEIWVEFESHLNKNKWTEKLKQNGAANMLKIVK